MTKDISTQDAIKLAQKFESNSETLNAINVYTQIIEQRPQCTEAILNRGILYSKIGSFSQSIIDFENILKLQTTNQASIPIDLIYSNLADNYLHDRNTEKAMFYYKELAKCQPDNDLIYLAVYDLLEKTNQLDKNIDNLKESIKNAPNSANTLYLKAKISMKKKEPLKKTEVLIQKALGLPLSSLVLPFILIDYANIKKQQKKYKEAFFLAKEAKEKALETYRFQKYIKASEKLDHTIQSSKKWPLIPNTSSKPNDSIKSPIFLLGFPRSGTTLAEQILFTRPNLKVTDELHALNYIAHNPKTIIGRPLQYPDDYLSMTGKELILHKKEYYNIIKKYIELDSENQTIVDKNPTSFRHLGLIQLLFPDSKIIMMIRDPRDVCISCFFQNFRANASNIHFCNIGSTIDYYINLMDLYLHYKKQLNLDILEIRYEDLCSDIKTHSQKMLNHIGEEWDESVLSFYKQDRYITTPSYNSVSQPIYTKAIGNWKNYEEQLAPYLPKLEPFIKEFGYI